jgi:menaquinone-specific isochorismate synthase
MTFPDPRSFRAVTVEVPPDSVGDGLDLISSEPRGRDEDIETVFSSTDIVIVGRGATARLELPAGVADPSTPTVASWLASVPTVDGIRLAGSGPLATGALPFLPSAPASLIVPAWTAVRHGDRAWVTAVGDASAPAPDAADIVAGIDRLRRPGPIRSDSSLAMRHALASQALPAPDQAPASDPALAAGAEEFVWAVKAALEAIGTGAIEKIVLARRVDAPLAGGFDPRTVLGRLRRREKSCTIFGVVEPEECFLGASPEVLVTRRGTVAASTALAGTAGLVGVDHLDRQSIRRLADSPKERAEHRIVVEAIASTLGTHCVTLDVPSEPSVVRLHSVAHLGTRLQGVLRNGTTGSPDALTLAAELHPTPAVGGSPTEVALDMLGELEQLDRGRYAGPVGWVDSRGDGDFVVGIRSATIRGSMASVYAGAGIVDGSDPDAELAETTLKLRTALSVLDAM